MATFCLIFFFIAFSECIFSSALQFVGVLYYIIFFWGFRSCFFVGCLVCYGRDAVVLLRALLSFLPHGLPLLFFTSLFPSRSSAFAISHRMRVLFFRQAYMCVSYFHFFFYYFFFLFHKLELHASVIIFYNCSQHKHKFVDSNRAETFLPSNWWIGLMATPTINAMTGKIENTPTKCDMHINLFLLLFPFIHSFIQLCVFFFFCSIRSFSV